MYWRCPSNRKLSRHRRCTKKCCDEMNWKQTNLWQPRITTRELPHKQNYDEGGSAQAELRPGSLPTRRITTSEVAGWLAGGITIREIVMRLAGWLAGGCFDPCLWRFGVHTKEQCCTIVRPTADSPALDSGLSLRSTYIHTYIGLSGPLWDSLGLSGLLWASLRLSGLLWASLGLSL